MRKAEITVKINGLAIPYQLRVLPSWTCDLLLRLDFLQITRAQIDFPEMWLSSMIINLAATDLTVFKIHLICYFQKKQRY